MYPELEPKEFMPAIFVFIIYMMGLFIFQQVNSYHYLNENKSAIVSIGQCDEFGWCQVKLQNGTSREAAFPIMGEKIESYKENQYAK